MALLHEDRLFPADEATRAVARRLYEAIRGLPIVSPHGHTQARGLRERAVPGPGKAVCATRSLRLPHALQPGDVSLEELEIGEDQIEEPREVWRIFASHYYLFRGTPTRLWLDYAFQEKFGLTERLSGEERGGILRHDRGEAADKGVFAAGAV